ncbi:MAG: hypothetical protein JO288_15490 [Hyphomicrobiales bacterium]|nr:hypothetical protein [Hyphomicrobiales bacterium]
MEYDEVKSILSEKTGLPKAVVNALLDLLGPLIILIALRELLEPLDLEPPAAQLVPICLTLCVSWLVLVHYFSGKPGWLSAATALLLLIACVVFYKLWILYHTDEPEHPIPLRVPFLFFAGAMLVHNVVQQHGVSGLARWLAHRPAPRWRIARPLDKLARHYATATPAVWREQSARVIGLCLFGLLLVAAIVRPSDWYLIADTLLASPVPEGKVGVLLAPFDKDKNDQARLRLWEDLTDLLGRTPELNRHVMLLQLPRPVPGYADDLAEQTETARKIGRYDRGSVVAYGSTTGEYKDYLAKTRIVLVEPFPFLEETLTVPRVVVGPPTNDARVVHMDALMIVGATSFLLGHCTSAEELFTEAAEVQRDITPKEEAAERTPQASQIALVTANSIGCEVMTGVAKAGHADDAFRLLDGILSDPASSTELRIAAANSKAFLYRGLAGQSDDAASWKKDLQAAINSLAAVLDAPTAGADPINLAAAWQGLGVAHEELERRIDPKDKPARRRALAEAKQAYEKAETFLNESASRKTAASPVDREELRAVVAANLASLMFHQGLIDQNPEEIAAAIPIYHRVLSTLTGTTHEMTVRDNLGDAYNWLVLDFHRDAKDNLVKARDQYELVLSKFAGPVGPSALADTVGKLGHVDLALAHSGDDSSAEAAGIVNLACARTLFRSAGREQSALSMEAALDAEQARIGHDTFDAALRAGPVPVKECQGTLR